MCGQKKEKKNKNNNNYYRANLLSWRIPTSVSAATQAQTVELAAI